MKATDHPEFIALLEGAFERTPTGGGTLVFWQQFRESVKGECFILASWLEDNGYDLLSKRFMEIHNCQCFTELNTNTYELVYPFFNAREGLLNGRAMKQILYEIARLPECQEVTV